MLFDNVKHTSLKLYIMRTEILFKTLDAAFRLFVASFFLILWNMPREGRKLNAFLFGFSSLYHISTISEINDINKYITNQNILFFHDWKWIWNLVKLVRELSEILWVKTSLWIRDFYSFIIFHVTVLLNIYLSFAYQFSLFYLISIYIIPSKY